MKGLKSAYKLPEDNSLNQPIRIEEIFFQDIRGDIRAEHEVYIGNYPVHFKEEDVRNLFQESGVEVGTIRMKYNSNNFSKVFAFVETYSKDLVEKAKSEME